MASMRKAFQYRVPAVLLAIGTLVISPAALADDNPPKELVQYVHDAKGRGLTEARIREQAQKVGWSSAMVDKAIAGETGGRKLLERNDTATAAPESRTESTNRLPTPVPVSGADSVRAVPEDYQIGPGDNLQISVWKEPDVTVPSVVVRSDGKITVPLIKEVEVGGLTPRQAEKLITDGLSKFITDANVTVVVAAVNSKKVYIIGAVKKEGTLPYMYGMSVMQALSEAGGLTDYAKRKKIYILRTESGRDYRLEFNYEEVVRGERMEQNIVLFPGDTVVIPH
jgi:polysaccharide export outer membrane protein